MVETALRELAALNNPQIPDAGGFETFAVVFFVVGMAFLVISLVAWAKIVSKAGYPAWWVLIGLIPFAGLIMFFIFAFSEWPIERQLTSLRLKRDGGYDTAFAGPVSYPPSGFAPTGYPPTGYLPTGYAPTGYAPTGYAPAGDAAPGGYEPRSSSPPSYPPPPPPPPSGSPSTADPPTGDPSRPSPPSPTRPSRYLPRSPSSNPPVPPESYPPPPPPSDGGAS